MILLAVNKCFIDVKFNNRTDNNKGSRNARGLSTDLKYIIFKSRNWN